MTTSTRIAPTGVPLDDGHATKITFAADTNVTFWEKSVKPPGLDGGDAIDQTTMFNTVYRTTAPRALKTLTEVSCTAAWDPVCYTDILALININGWITIRFPDGTTLDFVGFLKSFEPGELVEGTQPECTITVVPTNQLLGVETAAILTNVAGT